MSHLVEATIVGLAGRTKPLHMSFDRHLNILYGLNGSGKTSLLKILHSAMSGDAAFVENVPFQEATVGIYSVDFDKVFTRHLKKEFPAAQERTPKLPDEVVAQLELPEIMRQHLTRQERLKWSQKPRIKDKGLSHWRHRYLPTARLHVSDDAFVQASLPGLRGALSEELLDRFFAESLERLWASYTADILRAVRDSQERGLASILTAVLSTAQTDRTEKPDDDLKKSYESVQQFMTRQSQTRVVGSYQQFAERYERDSSLRQVVQDICRIEADIARAMSPRRKLQDVIQRLYTGGKKVDFGDKTITVNDSSGHPIGLSSLSSGEKHLMRLLVEALMAEVSTIMIDEPELSMHVDWQAELVSTFQTLNSTAQFVLATHSPEIMAHVDDKQVIVL